VIAVYRIDIGPYYYIGSSNKAEVRRVEHKRALDHNRHYNQKMQNIYNKHHDFQWSILAKTKTEEQCRQEEQKLLNKHFGNPRCMNLSSEALVPPKTNRKTKWNGRWYSSRIEAHKDSGLDICLNHFRKLYTQGCRSNKDVQEDHERKLIACNQLIEWNGELHSNKDVWTRLNIGATTLAGIRMFGAKSDDDLFRFKENASRMFCADNKYYPSCDIKARWNNRYYTSVNHIATDIGKPKSRVRYYYNQGARSDADLLKIKKKNYAAGGMKNAKATKGKKYKTKYACKLVTPFGEQAFKNMREASEQMRFSYSVIKNSLKENQRVEIPNVGYLVLSHDD